MTASAVAGARRVPSLGFGEQVRGVLALRAGRQVDFLSEVIAKHGDIAWIRMLGMRMALVNHPAHFEHVLVRNHENYDKDAFLFRTVDPILRGGLIGVVGGEPWRRQRRLMQPSFHRPQIAGFVRNMTEESAVMLDRWDGQYGPRDIVNVSTELGQLAMRIVFRSLFGARVGDRGDIIEGMFLEANTIAGDYFRFPVPPLSWPTRKHNRLRQIIRQMDGYVDEVIAERDATGEEHHDLLAALMAATYDETDEHMSRTQLHREVLNLIIGGYETTSNSVSWLSYLVGKHPDVQERLHEEVDRVLGGRAPGFDDLAELGYTRMVVDEMLRLYSPSWQTMRRAIGDDEIGGFAIPAGSDIYLNVYTLHRHPEFWADPEAFDPERFRPEAVAARPRSAYLPFGAGPRNCIGKHFARTELTVILAMMVQHYRIEVPPELPDVEISPLITLQPKGGVHVRVTRR